MARRRRLNRRSLVAICEKLLLSPEVKLVLRPLDQRKESAKTIFEVHKGVLTRADVVIDLSQTGGVPAALHEMLHIALVPLSEIFNTDLEEEIVLALELALYRKFTPARMKRWREAINAKLGQNDPA